ncbi:MAG: NYN domain-containing protein [Dechloromonas sp.]|nr:MAG: NYN domain-containing protein [Dechloromonas sp.]
MASPRSNNRPESEEHSLRLAVLIDADNAQASVIEGLLAEIARFGEASVKRIYGDFTSPNSAQWKKVLNQHAIKPVQQFAYTTGKNATDGTMIIDAMDLLYTRRFDGFCLVSSDSDFTGLALRIREEGLSVFGFGEEKTPDAFRNACHKFIFTEVLRPLPVATTTPASTAETEPDKRPVTPVVPVAVAKKALPLQFVLQALDQACDESGWANLGAFGSYLTKLQSDFDPRLYGFKKLSDLVRSKPHLFVVEERSVASSNSPVIYVRKKPGKTAQ